MSDDGLFMFYELCHPLESADANDFALKSGDTVGFYVTLWLSVGIQPALSISSEDQIFPPIGYCRLHFAPQE